MSELDLGGPVTTTPVAAGTFVLTPPAPVVVVEPQQAAGAVPVPAEKQVELRAKATAFVDDLTGLDPRSPEFAQKFTSIATMGEQEMRSAASMSNRMLDRPAAALSAGRTGGDAQARVTKTLTDLRSTVTELNPERVDLTGVKKVLKWIPGGDKVDRYFARYQSAQAHLNEIIKALDSSQDELRKDNAAIETEKSAMWTTMGRLSEYHQLATALDEAVESKIAQFTAAGRAADTETLKSDVLFPIRQRRQDFMTQMAVNVQGYLALDLIRKNNLELIRGVDRAQTTTIAALRIAVIVAQALSRQKLVLDQVNALNTVTSGLIEATSEQLRMQGSAINQQASASVVDVARLQAAFDNVFATMDAVDTFRTQAVDSMAQTVRVLEGQIERAQPYLERVRRGGATG